MIKSKCTVQILVLFIALTLTGCTAYKRKLALDECEKYGGAWGEFPVKTKGVFDRLRVLNKNDILYRSITYINNGLEFVEYSSEVVWLPGQYFKWGGPHFRRVREHYNYYRIFLTERGNPLCEPYEILFEKAKKSPLFKISDDQCLAVEGFDDPGLLRAKYEYRSVENIRDNKFVEWLDHQILERATKEVVAGFNWFSFCIGGSQRSVRDGVVGCYGGDDSFVACPVGRGQRTIKINAFEKDAFIGDRGGI